MEIKAVLFDENTLNKSIVRIAHQIVEKNENTDDICLVGIKTRGLPLANRLCEEISKIENKKINVGTLDITMYRDDLPQKNENVKDDSNIDFDITGKIVILADDVIYTGRTVRCALEAIMSYGRPSKIQLAVMVDRGHRELPICADYVGKNVPTARHESIKVNFREIDGYDSVELYER